MLRLIAVVLALTLSAHAETKGQWFKSLLQPDTGYSCCDISDCAVTNARFVDGRWEAEYAGIFSLVPASKILDKESYDGRAYLCARPGDRVGAPTIFCFVKPGGQS